MSGVNYLANVIGNDMINISGKEYVAKKYNFFSYIRPAKLSSDFVIVDNIIYDAFKYSLNKKKFSPDIVVFINSNAPCIKKEHIQKAIDICFICIYGFFN